MLQIRNSMNDHSTSTGRTWKRLCWAASWIALAGLCLAKAIPASPSPGPAAAKAASVAGFADRATALPAKQLSARTRSIEAIRVGDRVLGKNPQLTDKDRFAVDPDPSRWRKLELRMTKKNGKRLDMVLLRPLDWIQREHVKVGDRIRLDLPELGVVGKADVLSLGPCPPLASGNGSVVTATLAHQADDNLVNVRLEGLAEPIGSTAKHPFWSEDRHDFVPAESLRTGERVRSETAGLATVSAVTYRAPEPHVYNLEVHGEHVYQVASLGVLVHNTGGCADGAPKDDHFLEWELRGPRGGSIASGSKLSGVDFALPPGAKLTFPEQSLYGHTEGKVVADLMEAGKLAPGRNLELNGSLPPCPGCRNILRWVSGNFQMEISYYDGSLNLWAWKNGVLIAKP